MEKITFYSAGKTIYFNYYDEVLNKSFLISKSNIDYIKNYEKIFVEEVKPNFYKANEISLYNFMFNKTYHEQYKDFKITFNKIKRKEKDCFIYSLIGREQAIKLIERMIKNVDKMLEGLL